MKRVLILCLILTAVISGIYLGYQWYQGKKFVEAMAPYVKNTSLRTSNDLLYEIDRGSTITYNKFLERLEGDISAIDKTLLDVQNSTPAIKTKRDTVLSYILSCQALLRAQMQVSRKRDALANTMEWYNKINISAETNDNERQIALEKAATEYRAARKEFAEAISKMIKLRTKTASFIPAANLIDPDILIKIADIYSEDKKLKYNQVF